MVHLTAIHYTYLIFIILIIISIALKKDITLVCIIGIWLMGLLYTSNPVKAIEIIYKSIIVSGREFIDIIVVISLVNAMSKALKDIGADEIIIYPIKKLMINRTMAFFILGITMTVISLFLWPTAAVALIGAIMVPGAIKIGLPRIWTAVVLSLFGKGIALSGDFFIQGAPSITAKSAGIDDTFTVVKATLPFWLTIAIVSVTTAFILMKRETKDTALEKQEYKEHISESKRLNGALYLAIFTVGIFILDIVLMIMLKISGEEATALIGGTAVLILIAAVMIKSHVSEPFEKFGIYLKDGLISGMKVFGPIIIISAFFFIGTEDTAVEILGMEASGILKDASMFLSSKFRLPRISAILMEGLISVLVGINGSGFGGIPLIGTLARVFSTSINIDTNKIAAFGQVITIWIGGGTIIPWSVIPVAAICEVSPVELAKKNLIPVITGVIATFIVGLIWIY